MKSFVLAGAFGLLLMILGCDVPDRVSRLEKENQETKAEIEKIRTARSATADYDLQAKCSKDAKTFHRELDTRQRHSSARLLEPLQQSAEQVFHFVGISFPIGCGWFVDQ